MCAGTAGAAMLIVCSPPLPVLWQTSIFSWPLPKSPPSASSPVDVVWLVLIGVDGVVDVVLGAGWLSVEPVVTCARPTPAAAANASPTSAPTRERRVTRVSLLRTWNPFGAWGAGAYVWSVAIDGRNLRRALSDGGLRRGRSPDRPGVRRAARVGFRSP